MAFIDNLLPAVEGSGFRMNGYFVWCGSPIKGDDGRYYLFASRWPVETKFPEGYLNHSEIVLAVTERLDQPFRYVKTIITRRESHYWDSRMAHNPYILKIGKKYVLYYIGSDDGSWGRRRIGFATSDAIDGDWQRQDQSLDLLTTDSNNPAVLVDDDGSCLMVFRDRRLKIFVARAPRFDKKFEILNPDVYPHARVEDFYIFKRDGRYEMIAEDNDGHVTGHFRYGIHFISDDGVQWRFNDPMVAYTHDIPLTNGKILRPDRRERPSLLFEDGRITALFTAVQTGETTWNCVQPYAAKE